jgi:hypothetical protein
MMMMEEAAGGSPIVAEMRTRRFQRQAMQQAMNQYSQYRLGAEQQIGDLAIGLMDDDFRRKQLRKQTEGPGFGGILGRIAGTAAGAFFGGAGAAAGGKVGEGVGNLFE